MRRLCYWVLTGICITSAGCVRRQMRPATYRYVDHILIPPGVKDGSISERTISLPFAARCSSSESGLRFVRRGDSIRLTVNGAALAAYPPGWLAAWGASLEKEGCLANGES